jgi:hypothetical protein
MSDEKNDRDHRPQAVFGLRCETGPRTYARFVRWSRFERASIGTRFVRVLPNVPLGRRSRIFALGFREAHKGGRLV